MTQQLVPQQRTQYFTRPAVTQVGNGIDEGDGNEVVGSHARFDCGEDAEVGGGHGAHYCWIELHGQVVILLLLLLLGILFISVMYWCC